MTSAYVIQSLPDGRRALVFGLSWQTVFGEQLAAVAHKAARRAKAHYYTRGGQRSTAVGLLRLTRRGDRPRPNQRMYAAAALFARANPRGATAAVLDLPGGRRWVTAAVDGVVQMGTDHVFDNAEAAEALLGKLQERFPTLVIYGDATQAARLPVDALVMEMTPDTELRAATLTLSTVPMSWWAAAAVVLAYGLWNLGSEWWAEQEAQRRAAAQRAAAIDPTEAWRTALRTWAEAHPVLAADGLDVVLNAVLQAPVNPGRWQLAEIDCRPGPGACTARYRRSRLADNSTLRAALPPDWTPRWVDLDTADVQWHVDVPRRPPQLAALFTAARLESEWMPAVQGLRPALTGIDVQSPKDVAIPTPVQHDQRGTASPVPFPGQGLVRPRVRSLVINGPLRSLYALTLPPNTAVDQIQVRYQEATQPGLATSTFVTTLRGQIYVQ